MYMYMSSYLCHTQISYMYLCNINYYTNYVVELFIKSTRSSGHCMCHGIIIYQCSYEMKTNTKIAFIQFPKCRTLYSITHTEPSASYAATQMPAKQLRRCYSHIARSALQNEWSGWPGSRLHGSMYDWWLRIRDWSEVLGTPQSPLGMPGSIPLWRYTSHVEGCDTLKSTGSSIQCSC